jgi:hypothetical protein
VTSAHRPLLERCRTLLADRRYRDAQAINWRKRPPHLLGDQDVLTALLGSAEYADIPVKYLRRGRDIVQYFGSYGYTLAERLQHLVHGMPPFVHAQGYRPWWPKSEPGRDPYMKFNALYLELSPYTLLARRYRGELDGDDWMDHGLGVNLLRALGANRPPLVGLPLAAVADLVRLAKRALRRQSAS